MGVHAFFWFSSKSQVDPAPTGMEADSGPVAQEASPSVHPAPQLSREPSNPEAVEKSHAHRYLPRFSFRGWGWSRHQRASTHDKVTRGSKRPKTLARVLHPGSKKRAKESALLVRSVIVGPPTSASPKVTPVVAKPQLNKIRQQLSQPKTANKVIAQLRSLPSSDPSPGEAGSTPQPAGPIHAVCLSHTDAEEDALHFCHLKETGSTEPSGQNFGVPIMTSEPMERLTSMLNELRIIDLISQPDLGLGQPANGKGLFAGALPTPETVIKGFKQVTPQLMALGYATGRSITPNHAGIYPPTDRMSILTYWWGLEILLPPPTLEYLSNANSIAGTVVNFLSALSLVNGGVREILPFVRYISQFIDFEFNSIKKQDKGQGVVCAATWIMPAALVPRPWDFPTRPEESTSASVPGTEEETPPPADAEPKIDGGLVTAGPTLPS